MGILLRNSESHLQNEVSYIKKTCIYFRQKNQVKLQRCKKCLNNSVDNLRYAYFLNKIVHSYFFVANNRFPLFGDKT